jgi:hypothetical protein
VGWISPPAGGWWLWAWEDGLERYFDYYNHERPHQSLGYKIPAEIYFETAETIFC